MDIVHYVWIGLAGFVGANVRYLLGRWIIAQWGTAFPYATLAINISGSFVLCFLLAWWEHGSTWPPPLRVAVTVGFLGAYTTFSTFSYECLMLLHQVGLGASLLYIGASILGGICAGSVGLLLGRWL